MFKNRIAFFSYMADKIPKDALRIAAALSNESGVPLDDILHKHIQKAEGVAQKIKAPPGEFRVVGIDKYDGSDWVQGDFDSMEEALQTARSKTSEARKNMLELNDEVDGSPRSPCYNIATVYYAYNSQGNYLGGDVWNDE